MTEENTEPEQENYQEESEQDQGMDRRKFGKILGGAGIGAGVLALTGSASATTLDPDYINLNDDDQLQFGNAPDFLFQYDSTNTRMELVDNINATDVFRVSPGGKFIINGRNLDIGGNSIVNVTNVDGVDVSAHAGNASAHHTRPSAGAGIVDSSNTFINKFGSNSSGRDSQIPGTKVSGKYSVVDSIKFGAEGSSTSSTSFTTIQNSDTTIDFDRYKDENGQVYINVLYHIRGDTSARIFRQNAGTAVSGTKVNRNSSGWGYHESGWVDMSSESGWESYQVQLRSDDGSEDYYNSVIMLIANPQG